MSWIYLPYFIHIYLIKTLWGNDFHINCRLHQMGLPSSTSLLMPGTMKRLLEVYILYIWICFEIYNGNLTDKKQMALPVLSSYTTVSFLHLKNVTTSRMALAMAVYSGYRLMKKVSLLFTDGCFQRVWMWGTSRALQMDWTALTEELWDGPNTATTPRASWSHTVGEEQGENNTKSDGCHHSLETVSQTKTIADQVHFNIQYLRTL